MRRWAPRRWLSTARWIPRTPAAVSAFVITAHLNTCRPSSDTITLEDIEVEFVGCEVPDARADPSKRQVTEHHHESGVVLTSVESVDAFSKSKVLNFMKRAAKERGGHFSSTDAFVTETHTLDVPGSGLSRSGFRCRLRVVCPPSSAQTTIVGEGVAANAKDAELLAAMHAERLLDALGVPLYALPSMQQKHAEAARAAGRWAPLPGERPPHGAHLPPPLVLWPQEGNDVPARTTRVDTRPHVGGGDDDGPCAGPNAVLLRDLHEHAQEVAEVWASMSAADAAGAGMYDATERNTFQPCVLTSTRFSTTNDGITLPIVHDKAARLRIAAYMRHHGREFDRSLSTRQVAVQGTSFRMHVAELRVRADLVACGKAMDVQSAVDLAAMHAELLLDFHGDVLFPDDAERQQRHAELARGCGRWAPMTTGEERPPYMVGLAAPLALKQQLIQSDDVSAVSPAGAMFRSAAERIVALHNAVNETGDNTFVEVNPPVALLQRYRRLLREWLLRQDCCFPDLFLCTRMGEFARASLVLPLPAEFGVRGGNSVGRTAEQASDLCALHCVDLLCLLGIPLCENGDEQEAFAAERRALGLVINAPGSVPPSTASLPGYYIEGPERALPRHAELRAAMSFADGDYNVVPGSAEDIVARGNMQKPQVQAYLRLTLGHDRLAVVTQTGSSPTVRNVAYVMVPLPTEKFGPNRSVVAVGQGLKKKDADRVCFMHAYAILEANGVSMERQKETELQLAKQRRRGVNAAVVPGSAAAVDSAVESAASEPKSEMLAEPVYVAPQMHPALATLRERDATLQAAKRSRLRLSSERM
jgi:hypothetical protein